MRLYHGTSTKTIISALSGGLKARALTGVPPNDCEEAGYASSADAVYLTNTWRLFFAIQVADPSRGECPTVLEVETDRLKAERFTPDEDYLEQNARVGDILAGRAEREAPINREKHDHFRSHLMDYADQWEQSVAMGGCCAYHGVVPPQAITRVLYIPPTQSNLWLIQTGYAERSAPNILACARYGEKYRKLVQYLFDPRALTAADLDPFYETLNRHQRRQSQRAIEHLRVHVVTPADLLRQLKGSRLPLGVGGANARGAMPECSGPPKRR